MGDWATLSELVLSLVEIDHWKKKGKKGDRKTQRLLAFFGSGGKKGFLSDVSICRNGFAYWAILEEEEEKRL